MEISQRFDRGAIVVRMQGGMLSERDLERLDLITDSYANSGMKHVIFDIRGVVRIDQQMVKSLRRAERMLGRIQGEVRLIRPRNDGDLGEADLSRYFRTFSSVDQALESIN